MVQGRPGIVVVARGRPEIVLELTIGADRLVHRIEIGGRDRLGAVALTLVPGQSAAVGIR
jgi:hypothetical protein